MRWVWGKPVRYDAWRHQCFHVFLKVHFVYTFIWKSCELLQTACEPSLLCLFLKIGQYKKFHRHFQNTSITGCWRSHRYWCPYLFFNFIFCQSVYCQPSLRLTVTMLLLQRKSAPSICRPTRAGKGLKMWKRGFTLCNYAVRPADGGLLSDN